MKNEPLYNVATLTSAAAAIVALLVSFGIPLSEEQQTAILGVASVIAPFVVAAIARKKVTPTAKAKRTVDHLA